MEYVYVSLCLIFEALTNNKKRNEKNHHIYFPNCMAPLTTQEVSTNKQSKTKKNKQTNK